MALPLALSSAAGVDPRASFEAWLPLAAGEAVDGEALAGWLKAQQRALPAPSVRHVVVTAPAAQAALAERIAARLDGAVDARGFVVEAVALAEAPGGAALAAMLAMPLRSWRLAGRLFGRLLAGASRGASWRDQALGTLVRAFGVGRGDFELLELERSDAEAMTPLPALFARALADGALARVVLVRPPRRAAAPLPAGYSALLVLAPGGDLGLQAAGIADHVLALDFVAAAEAEAVAAEREREPKPEREPEPTPAPSACIIGSALLVCAAGLGEPLRGDLVRAIVLAHRAADVEAPALAQFDVWQRSFGSALANIGYSGSTDLFSEHGVVDAGEADPQVAVERLVLPAAQEQRSQVTDDVLAAAWQQARQWGFGATANALLGRSMPFGRFVLALADRAPDGVPRLVIVTLVQQPDEATAPDPRILKTAPNLAIESPAVDTPSSDHVRRFVQTSAGTIDASLLAGVRDTLRERVAPHYDSMVVELPLDRSRPA
ncbi:MAG TPA: hypothetical protein VK876_08785 [Rubrivivax sp.]|nr:hypothetical protein [Rubrivivax sp.]